MTIAQLQHVLERAGGIKLTEQIERRMQRPAREALTEARARFMEHFTPRSGRFLRSITARQRPSSRMPSIQLRASAKQANILEFGGRTHPGGKRRKGGFMLTKASASAAKETPDLTLDSVEEVVMGG